MALNRKVTTTWTPAGNKPTVTPGTYGGLKSGIIKKVEGFYYFETNGTGAPLNQAGDPAVITRTGVGLYQLQLGGASLATGKTGQLKQLLLFQPMLNTGAASVLRAQGGTVDLVNGIFQIRLVDATATLTDLAAASGNFVTIDIVWSNGAL